MLKSKYFLLFLVFAILICTCSCSSAENIPSFIKVNKDYIIKDLNGHPHNIHIVEIDNTGWIKSDETGSRGIKESGVWYNLNNIREIEPNNPTNK